MRIGIDVTSAITQGGGIGRYTRELIHALAKEDANIEYRYFSAKPIAPSPIPNSIPQTNNSSYHPAPLNERWLYRLWYRAQLPIPVQWVTGKLDLFHSPDFVLPPTSGHIPTLLTVHDISFAFFPEVYPPNLVAYLNKVVPRSVQRATHILADSQATKDDLVRVWHVSPAKITVLYCGADPRFQPIRDEKQITAVRQKYHLGKQPYILSVGTVQPRKNYQMLIRAFAPIAQEQPHNLIISGGKGWLYDEMLAEVGKQGLNGRVHFIGFVDDADLPALYSEAALFVMPSIYEGFGLPILEAMGCGTAVISSNVSSLPEVTGDTAVLISPNDQSAWTTAILDLLNNPTKQKQLIADGYEQIKQFSWQKSAQQLIQLYADLK